MTPCNLKKTRIQNIIMQKLLMLLVLVLGGIQSFASKVDTLLISSESMNISIPNLVILPDAYDGTVEKFPVLYLLHGASGNFLDWTKKAPHIQQLADTYNYIIVCPDGGHNSWYFNSPIDESMQYETYISKELIAAIDEKYNTRKTREGRAISGLSMGGHGAFYLAFKHQEIWGAAGSTSGGLDIRPFPKNWDIAKRLGSYAENKNVWEENTVINLVYLLKGNYVKLLFDCGTDDFFHDANKRMHEKLMERKIPHDYIERPGKHNNEYWANSIKYQLLFFSEFFKEQK